MAGSEEERVVKIHFTYAPYSFFYIIAKYFQNLGPGGTTESLNPLASTPHSREGETLMRQSPYLFSPCSPTVRLLWCLLPVWRGIGITSNACKIECLVGKRRRIIFLFMF